MNAAGRAAGARFQRIDLALVLGVLGSAAWLVSAGARVIQEDGFYYLEIARNVAGGRGSTFDGLHATNGYQPLWLACLVPLFWMRPSAEAAMAAVILLQAALLSAATVLVVRLARESGLPAGAAAIAGCVWVGLTARTALSGVEFALTAALVSAVALRLKRHAARVPETRACAAMGLLLGLALLARLDTSLLALLVIAEWGARLRRAPGGGARITALGAPTVVLAAGYAVANEILFGHPWPVSGAAKRLWSLHLLEADTVHQAHGWLAAKAWHLTWPLRHPLAAAMPAVIVGGLLAGALLWIGEGRRTWRALGPVRDVLRGLRPLVAFAGLQLVAYVAAYHGHYTYAPWYYVAQPLLAALVAGAAAHALVDAVRARAQAAALLTASAVLLAGLGAAGGLRRASWDEPLYVAARWARDHLEPGARLGSWNAGAISFLSGRQVVNLDGVVNSFAYLERDQYDLCGYWDRTGITYLVDVFEAREGSSAMKGTSLPVSAFYAACADRLQIVWSEPQAGNPGWPKAVRITSPTGPPPAP